MTKNDSILPMVGNFFEKISRHKMFSKLQNKIAIILTAILFVMVGINNWISGSIFVSEYSEALKSEMMVVGEGLKNQMDRLLGLGMAFEDLMGFEEQCSDVVNKYKYISYAAVVNREGRVLFHNDETRHRMKIRNPELIAAIKSESQLTVNYTENGQQSIGIVIPIINEAKFLGAVVLTVPQSVIMEKVAMFVGYSVLVSVFCFAAALFSIMTALSIWVNQPLTKLTSLMEEVGKGNLTINIGSNSRDEIGEAIENFSKMIANIRSLIIKVNTSAHNVINYSEQIAQASDQSYSASEQIAVTMQDITKGSSDQTNEISVIAGYMDDLSQGLNKVGQDMGTVTAIVNNTQGLSETAIETVQILTDKATETNTVSKGIVDDINSLNQFMIQIDDIVKVIAGITEQTNLLALNAAIEAARAGDKGKGFAVVAEEIRKLADQSKDAATTIKRILNNIQHKTFLTVKVANNAMLTIEQQMLAVKDADKAFATIFEQMDRIIHQANEVEHSVNSIMTLKAKTVAAIENIHSFSEETAATTEEVSASTQEQKQNYKELLRFTKHLSEMAEELNESITIFKV